MFEIPRYKSSMTSATRDLPIWLRAIHWVILINFALQIFYGSYMTFFVVRPEGVSGPLWGAASSISHEMMMTRRLYASETWVAIVGMSLYFAITEVLPRQLRSALGKD